MEELNFIEKVLAFFATKIEAAPTNYGVLHICFLLATIVGAVLLSIKFKDADDKTDKKILLIFWLSMVGLEIFKQVIMSFENMGTYLEWRYPWYIFPFQFCATPLYVLPIAIFVKNKFINQAAHAFLATFVLFGGLCVMIYPNDVFISTISISVQSMTYHGGMVVIAIYTIVRSRKHFTLKWIYKAVYVFVAMIAVAMLLNEIMFAAIPEHNFNMFYVSPHYPCTLPVLNMIYPAVPYIAFLAIYIFGFALAALVMFSISKGVMKIIDIIKTKKPLLQTASGGQQDSISITQEQTQQVQTTDDKSEDDK